MHNFELKVLDNGSESVPYNAPEFPVYAGSAWLHKYKGMGVVNHWHWDFEFAYILHGQMSYSVNHDTVTIREGEGIFINSGQIHRNFSMDGTDSEYRCALFHPSVLRTAFRQTEQLLRALSGNSNMPYIILRPDAAWQKSLLADINALYESIIAGVGPNAFGILSHAFHIAQTLADHLPRTSEETADPRDISTMREMVGYIQTHYRETIRVADISRAGMVGNSTCYTLFRKFFGASPMKYLTDYRLEKAAGLLKNTDMPVCDIADMTGFASPSYFAECFKGLYGVPPTAFRQSAVQ